MYPHYIQVACHTAGVVVMPVWFSKCKTFHYWRTIMIWLMNGWIHTGGAPINQKKLTQLNQSIWWWWRRCTSFPLSSSLTLLIFGKHRKRKRGMRQRQKSSFLLLLLLFVHSLPLLSFSVYMCLSPVTNFLWRKIKK